MMSTTYALAAALTIPHPLSFFLRLEVMGTMEELFPKPTWSRSMSLKGWTVAAMEMKYSDLLLQGV